MKRSMYSEESRVFWIDCFKALAIMLVVIGHATGRLNGYIYQFHMAAFFFISGYCTHWKKGEVTKTLWKRFYCLIFPLVAIFLAGAFFMALMNHFGVYEAVWGKDLPYVGLKNMIFQFFTTGANYVWWMGASWFLQVLMEVCILHACIWGVLNYRGKHADVIFTIMIIIIYLAGYWCVKNRIAWLSMDLVFIAQLYFGIGTLCSHITKNNKGRTEKRNVWWWLGGCMVTAGVMYWLSGITGITTDYASRSFHHIIFNFISAMNGIAFLYCVSRLIDMISVKIRLFRKGISWIGENTIGIVFFHFLMFKLTYIILILFHATNKSVISQFTPEDPIGWNYLWLFLIVSVIGSIGIWKLLTLTRPGRVLMGVDREFRNKSYLKIESLTAENRKRKRKTTDEAE